MLPVNMMKTKPPAALTPWWPVLHLLNLQAEQWAPQPLAVLPTLVERERVGWVLRWVRLLLGWWQTVVRPLTARQMYWMAGGR